MKFRLLQNPKPRRFLLLKIVFGLVLLTCASIPGYAENTNQIRTVSSKPEITSDVIKKVFNNGLVLLIKPNHTSEAVAINLYARMGPLYEIPTQKGISAFMQRILFKGGTTSRNLTQINDELEMVGAFRNSVSFSDYGNVSLAVTKAGLNRALNVYIDVIRNPIFSNGEVENGKKEVIQEFKAFGDQPFNTASIVFNKSFFGEHPYSGQLEGNTETVGAFKQDDVLAWYHKIYIPNNMVFSVVGNVDPEAIIKKFQVSFGELPKGELPKASSLSIPNSGQDLVMMQPKMVQGTFIILGYSAPDALSIDLPAMTVLNTILGGGVMSNRLYTELREKRGLAYFVGSFYQPRLGPSAIFTAMVTSPENYQVARDGIVCEFKKFSANLVSDEELENAKKYIKGTFMMLQETSAARGSTMGVYELLGYGYQYFDRYQSLINQVTADDIQRVAKKYFNHYVLAVVAPKESVKL